MSDETQDPLVELSDADKAGILLGVAEDLLRTEAVESLNRTEDEIARDLWDELRARFASEDLQLTWIIDQRDELLEEARRTREAEKPLIACLLYTTWIEHWLNSMIIDSGESAGLDGRALLAKVRNLSVDEKINGALPELGVPRIPAEHSALIRTLVRRRNEYVHYKWQRRPLDSKSAEREDDALEEALAKVEETLDYLIEMQRSYSRWSDKRAVARLLSIGRPDLHEALAAYLAGTAR
jgi:hypothetical protein